MLTPASPFTAARPQRRRRHHPGLLMGLLAAGLSWPAARAQCPAGSILATASGHYTLTTGQTLCIPAGVTFTGSVTVAGSDCVISNRGEVATTNITLQQPATLSNYGTWSAEHYSNLPAGTVLDNRGSWVGTIYNITNGLTLSNAGTWSAALYGNSGTQSLNLTNSGTWQSSFSLTATCSLTNTATGQWRTGASPSLTGATTIQNAGTWQAGASPNVTGSLRIQNTGSWYPAPNFTAGALSVQNSGSWYPVINFSAGNADVFENLAGGLASVPNIYFNGAGRLDNRGSLTVSGTLYISNASVLHNYAGASFSAPGGTNVAGPSEVRNAGTWTSASYVNNGRTTNAGTLETSAGLLTRGTLLNEAGGTVRTGTSLETASGSSTTHAGFFTVGTDFTNRGLLDGPAAGPAGRIDISGVSTNTGSFAPTGKLLICDAGHPAGGWDVQAGTVEAANMSACYPLPVTLLDFTARRAGATVQLRWSTAQELRNAGFGVEKSADTRHWQQIGFVPGRGSSSTAHDYAYQDSEAGAAYYRLVQQDTDGTETRSDARYVPGGAPASLQLSPNPAATSVQLLGAEPGAKVHLLTSQGRVLRRYPTGSTRLDVRGLPAGLYLVRCGRQLARLTVQ